MRLRFTPRQYHGSADAEIHLPAPG
jgi:hypothetical protein